MLLVLSALLIAIACMGVIPLSVGATPIHHVQEAGVFSRTCQQLGMRMCAGILLTYLLVMILPSVGAIVGCSALLAALGAAQALLGLRRSAVSGSLPARPSPTSTLAWAALALALVFLTVTILAEPLQAWDTRAIWMMHARKVFLDGTVWRSVDWTDFALKHTHPDYPKLGACIAAHVGWILGYWNDYCFKFALLLIVVPAFFLTCSFAQKQASFVLLLAVFFLGMGGFLECGYFDGYCALYFGLALAFFGRFLSSHAEGDVIAACLCCGVLLGLKNEGALLTLCAVGSFGLCALVAKRATLKHSFVGLAWPRLLLTLGLVFAPLLAWSVYKAKVGLNNDLGVGTAEAVERTVARLQDGQSLALITRGMVHDPFHRVPAMLQAVFALAVASMLLSRRLNVAAVMAAVAACIYFAGIFVIYLLTPKELGCHLDTSVARTVMAATYGGCTAMYFLLLDVENTTLRWLRR